jgi:uncharacterized protein (TIGR00251 family)
MPTKTIRITIKVKPNSRTSKLEAGEGDAPWTVWLKSPPIDGKANRELINMVTKHFGCKKANINIKHGLNSRSKVLEINT